MKRSRAIDTNTEIMRLNTLFILASILPFLPLTLATPIDPSASVYSTFSSTSVLANQDCLPTYVSRNDLPRDGIFLARRYQRIPVNNPPEKHFRESAFDAHYDGRFTTRPVSSGTRQKALRNLVKSYLATMEELGVEAWLMHGTLLGWWWSGRILPWDSDLDVQIMGEEMGFLAGGYNMSTWNFGGEGFEGEERCGGGERKGTDYLLEINPHFRLHDGSAVADMNVIDARWIDTTTGLYIDITSVWKSTDHPAGSGILIGKDGHEFRVRFSISL